MVVGGVLAAVLSTTPLFTQSIERPTQKNSQVVLTTSVRKPASPKLRHATPMKKAPATPATPAVAMSRESVQQKIHAHFPVIGESPASLPTINESTIRWQLNRINPKVASLAPDIMMICKEYRVNPAYVIAKWNAENNCDQFGVGAKTKSIGNIRYTKPTANSVPYTNYKGFRSYATYQDAIIDFCRLTKWYQEKHGLTTVEQITNKWTPASENQTKTHQEHILGLMRNMYTHAWDEQTQTKPAKTKP